MKTKKDRIKFALHLAHSGYFGTPENPKMDSSGKADFWNCFNGVPASKYKGCLSYAFAAAGELYRKEISTQPTPGQGRRTTEKTSWHT